MDAGTLISELKRRRVFRVLVGYGIVAFAVLQIIEPIQHGLGLPDWVLKLVVVMLGLGFPVAVVLAWAFDVNEGRIERAAPAASPKLTGTRLALLLVPAHRGPDRFGPHAADLRSRRARLRVGAGELPACLVDIE